MLPTQIKSVPVQSSSEANFVSRVCLPFLQAAQNDDGGWGFRLGSQSRAEPTAWALLALRGRESSSEREHPISSSAIEHGGLLGEQRDALLSSELRQTALSVDAEPGRLSSEVRQTALSRTHQVLSLDQMKQGGIRFLRSTQLPDGSWPAAAGETVGCWATSLVCWALVEDQESRTAVSTGLRWICKDWPRDSGFLARMIRKIFDRGTVTQNERLRGWGWTPHTASWIEPTAFALIALNEAPRELLPAEAAKRCEIAKLLIYDRMCPGGGWSCGNPVVYGVAGDPLVEPTVWALLALRDEPDSEKKALSLQWLERNLSRTAGPGSLALAKICLDMYGREWPADAPNLADLYEQNEFLANVPVMAWACLATSGERVG